MRNGLRLLALAALTVIAGVDTPVFAQVFPTGSHSCPVGATDINRAPAPVGAAIDPAGIYAGTVTPVGGHGDRGVIFVSHDNGVLNVTVGPDTTQMFRATQVEQVGRVLRFSFVPPDDVPRTITFEMRIDGRKMSGTATMFREGVQVATARLVFMKQEVADCEPWAE